MENLRKFIELGKAAIAIADSDADPEVKYDMIFSDEIAVAMRATGYMVDYYDPDTSYEEDVAAYANAVRERVEQMEKALADVRPS